MRSQLWEAVGNQGVSFGASGFIFSASRSLVSASICARSPTISKSRCFALNTLVRDQTIGFRGWRDLLRLSWNGQEAKD